VGYFPFLTKVLLFCRHGGIEKLRNCLVGLLSGTIVGCLVRVSQRRIHRLQLLLKSFIGTRMTMKLS
jgi:hypothetical protein